MEKARYVVVFESLPPSQFYEQQSAWYEAMSADAPAKDGVNASAVVVDEIHRHKKRDMFDVLEYSISSRRSAAHAHHQHGRR